MKKIQYLGGNVDHLVQDLINKESTGTKEPADTLEFLFKNNHLKEANRAFNELLSIDSFLAAQTLAKINACVRPTSRIIHIGKPQLLEEIALRGCPTERCVPNIFLEPTLVEIKEELGWNDTHDKQLSCKPINVESKDFLNAKILRQTKYLSSTSLLWMDLFELALFSIGRPYERHPDMSFVNDPAGAAVALCLKNQLEMRTDCFEALTESMQYSVVEQWKNISTDSGMPLPFIDDIPTTLHGIYFSADPYPVARIFLATEIAFHREAGGTSLWDRIIHIVSLLPPVEFHLVDFQSFLPNGALSIVMDSPSINALSTSMTTGGKCCA